MEPVSYLANLQTTRNPLASYAELPNGVGYQDQEADEKVALLLRRHPATTLRWIIPGLFAALLPFALPFIPLDLMGLEALTQIPGMMLFALTVFWYILVAGYLLENLLIWYYNVYLVTNQRILDVDFHGLMHYASDEAALHQIQDVQHKQLGIWQLLFGYGHVYLQTSGTKQNLEFDRVPQPHRVADIITDLLPRPTDVSHDPVTIDNGVVSDKPQTQR